MNPSDYAQLRRNVILSEGLRLKPYTDVGGRLTIGYGRNLTDRGITQGEANAMLDTDLATAIADVQAVFPFVVGLDPVRMIVLAELSFNLGITRLMKFIKMWDDLKAKRYADAAVELLNSQWAGQVGARATRLADALSKGVFE